MITSTFLAVLFVPVFYVVCQGLSERRAARPAAGGGHVPLTSTQLDGSNSNTG